MNEDDQYTRRRALDVNHSFIVRSPAGSGKTQLLTLRFLALLSNVHKDPEEVLAITFTRKAAAEMRERVLHALLKADEDPTQSNDVLSLQTRQLAQQVLARDKQEDWNLLENPNRLRIQTIDSFCAYLARQMPISSHFSTSSQIIDDPSFLYLQAARETLNEIDCEEAWSCAIEQLLLHLDNSHERIEKLLVDMLARRDQWLPYLTKIQGEDRVCLEQGLSQIVQEHLIDLVAIFPKNYAAELLSLLHYAASQVSSDHPLTIFAERDQFPSSRLEDYPAWIAIANFLLTKEGQWRKTVTQQQGFPAQGSILCKEMKARALDVLRVLSENERLRELLVGLSFLPPLRYSDQQWLAVTAWLKILPVLLAHLKLLFQREGVADYIEVSLSAQEALGDVDSPSDLALSLDHQIHHILVDEFQDTSFSQWHLLEKMIAGWQPDDGRTLFLVGDPMQSIYRFRKAEVSLFLRAAEQGIGGLKLEPLTLQMNFRSAENLVDWANKLFVNLMPSDEDPRCGAITFIPSIPTKVAQMSVEWYPLVNTDDLVQAKKIIDIIHLIFTRDPNAKIAILVKARSHAQPILPLLRAANIAYQAMELEQLASRSVITDLLALTRAFLNPADRIAWLAVLRAPWCGLELADLDKIAGIEPKKTIWERISAIAALGLSQEGEVRLAYFVAIMKQNLSQRGCLPLRATIEKIWHELKGPLCLTDLNEQQNSHVFFAVLEELEVAGDILDISQLEQRLSSRYATSVFVANSPVVEVMTIHKAKGLEFDHVILPGLERKTAQDDSQLLLWSEHLGVNQQSCLILGPIKDTESEVDPIYRYLRRQEAEKARYEMLRLFYVAVTRAKQSLHLMGTVNYQPNTALKKPSTQSFLGQVWPNVEMIFKRALPEKLVEEGLMEVQTHRVNHDLRRLKKMFFIPAFPLGGPLNTPIVNQPKYSIKQQFAQSVGIVIHQNLQYLNLDDLNKCFQPTASRQMLLELGVALSDIDEAVGLVDRAIENVTVCKRGRWIFSQAHQDIHAEYPFSYLKQGRLVSCVIDRTFIDTNGVRWIIDFKNPIAPIENVDTFLQDEKQRYQAQLNQYATLMYALDPRPIRLGLYFPLQSVWVEWV